MKGFKVVFLIILGILVFFSFYRYTNAGDPLTFYDFILSLKNVSFDFDSFLRGVNDLTFQFDIIIKSFSFNGSATFLEFLQSFFFGLPYSLVEIVFGILIDIVDFTYELVRALFTWFGLSPV